MPSAADPDKKRTSTHRRNLYRYPRVAMVINAV